MPCDCATIEIGTASCPVGSHNAKLHREFEPRTVGGNSGCGIALISRTSHTPASSPPSSGSSRACHEGRDDMPGYSPRQEERDAHLLRYGRYCNVDAGRWPVNTKDSQRYRISVIVHPHIRGGAPE